MTLDDEWFETLARIVVSRSSAAKKHIATRAETLGRSRPQVLPGFFERVGRTYIALGKASDAATMFARAREAEEVHALASDSAQEAVKFALAGALTAKSMSKHAKTLAASRTPDEALDEFMSLCVDWHKGGLPPYAAMHKDIARLAKAAKRELPGVVRALLAEIIFARAIGKAGLEFWEFCRTELVALAREAPVVRGRLLGIMPTEAAVHDLWVEILVESGASAGLIEPAGSVDPLAEAPDGPASWLTRFAAGRKRWRSGPLLDLASAMAARLHADGVPVDLFSGITYPDLDLLDLCLAERIPLARTQHRQHLYRVDRWLADGRRDLAAVAADNDCLPHLVKGVADELERDRGEVPPSELAALLNAAGLRTALSCWLERQADGLRGDSLVVLKQSLVALKRVRVPAAFDHVPQTLERIATATVAHALAATLRGGIFDEFGWPALEEAVARLLEGERPTARQEIVVAGGGWPALVLRYGDKMVVVGPDSILMEHLIQRPAGVTLVSLDPIADFVDGRMLLAWDVNYSPVAYWSDAPAEVFSLPRDSDWSWSESPLASLAMPDGGRFTGHRPLRAGDTTVPRRARVHSDGTTYWRVNVKKPEVRFRWLEIDPSTGQSRGERLPEWIECFGTEVDLSSSWLRPAPPGIESNPLGYANGMLGWRVREEPDGSLLGERIDGVQFRLPDARHHLLGALSFPGAGEPRGIAWYQVLDQAGNPVADLPPGGCRPEMARGTSFVPPRHWWCCLRVRDEAGSRALRSVTEDMAGRLLDGEDLAAVLPEVTHPELITGVLGMVGHAGKLQDELRAYQEMIVAPESVEEPAKPEPKSFFVPILTVLGRLAEQSAAGEKLIAEPLRQLYGSDWLAACANPAAIARQAAALDMSAEHRVARVEFLRAITDNLAEGSWRAVEVVPGGSLDLGVAFPTPDGFVLPANILRWKGDTETWCAVQFSTGSFTLPEGWQLLSAEPIGCGFSRVQVATFCAALETNGPPEWRPELVDELTEQTGLSRGEAVLLLAGLPGTGTALDLSTIGLTTATAAGARERFERMPESVRMALLGAGMPGDPVALWTTGPDVAGIASEWNKRFGRRTAVPDDLLVKARQQLPLKKTAQLLSDVLNPDDCAWLNTDPRMSFVDDRWVPAVDDAFSTDHLLSMRHVLPWLAYHLPAGSPVRARLSRTFSLIRDRLRHPEFCFSMAYVWAEEPMRKLLDLPPDMIVEQQADVDGWLRVASTGGRWFELLVRTSEYRPEHRPTLVALLDLLRERPHKLLSEAVLVFMGPEIEQACSLASPDLDAYYQDPTVSVPDLVDVVAGKYTLDSDAAALYLQILALPDPTDANVARWTGWKPARLKAARAALAETGLVVSAKRARAGRSLFLPGGWRVLKSPHLPIEVWKEPLFGLGADPPAVAIVPVGPVEQLFRQAWQRIEDGDAP